MMEMPVDLLLTAAGIFIFAAVVHGIIGFGFPMVATPLLAISMDLSTAIAVTLIPTLLMNLISIWSEGNILEAVKKYWLIALLAMLGSAVGTRILIHAESDIFKLLLAGSIVFYLFAAKIRFSFHWVRRHSVIARFVFGLSAGILGGLTNVMAPVLIIYSLESGYGKKETVQLSNLCFLFGKGIQIVLFAMAGKLNSDVISSSSLAMAVGFIGLYVGMNIRHRIEVDLYRKLLRYLLAALAGVLTVQFFI